MQHRDPLDGQLLLQPAADPGVGAGEGEVVEHCADVEGRAADDDRQHAQVARPHPVEKAAERPGEPLVVADTRVRAVELRSLAVFRHLDCPFYRP